MHLTRDQDKINWENPLCLYCKNLRSYPIVSFNNLNFTFSLFVFKIHLEFNFMHGVK